MPCRRADHDAAGAGSLTNGGVAVTAGQFIAVADIRAGNLVFTPAANANGAAYASFTFQVQDDGGTANGGVDLDPSANVLTINVTAVNDAPGGANNTVTTLEDTAYTFAAADFGFSDAADSPANALTAVRITTLPAAGSLTNGGVAVTAGQFIAVADITAGNLVFTPAANANGAAYASFTFQVQDDGGTANGGVDLDPTANVMTVNVTAVNDAPGGANNTVTTLEDTAYTSSPPPTSASPTRPTRRRMPCRREDHDAARAGSLTNGGVAVTAGQFISRGRHHRRQPGLHAGRQRQRHGLRQLHVPGAGRRRHGQRRRRPRSDRQHPDHRRHGRQRRAQRDQQHGHDAGRHGLHLHRRRLRLHRPGRLPGERPHRRADHDAAGAGSLTNGGVAVTAGQFIAVADIAAGNLVFTPAANANGTAYASFTFQVQDDGGTANGGVDLDPSANTLTINVTAVNDAPSGANKTVTTLEDTAYTFAAADFGFSDPADTPANTLPPCGSRRCRRRHPDQQRRRGHGRPVHRRRRHHRRQPGLHAGRQRQRRGLRQLHVPGPGRRRHGQRRRRPRSERQHHDHQRHRRQRRARRGQQHGHHAGRHGLHLHRRRLRLQRPGRSPGQHPHRGADHDAARAGTLTNGGVAVTAGQFIAVADIAAGNLVFTPAANANGAAYASFTFQVQDDGGTANGGVDLDPTANALTINVTAVNDAPSGANNTVTTLEDTAYTFTAADFGFSDPADSPGQRPAAVRITTLPAAGTLTNSGVAVTAGQFIAVADIAAGNLVFTPAANANGAAYASFTFQVQDDGGTANGGVDLDPTANTLTINVTAVNDAPGGTNNTVTTLEDTAYTFTAADFGFTDPADTPANALAGGADHDAAGRRHPDQRRRRGHGRPVHRRGRHRRRQPGLHAGRQRQRHGLRQLHVPGAGRRRHGQRRRRPRSDRQHLTINVTAVNDAPGGTNKTVTTLEDTAYTFTAADFGFSDPADTPANTLAAVRITTLPAPAP